MNDSGSAGGTARRLHALLHRHGVVLVNHRRIPGSRTSIDHLAIGPGGVTVIDAKRIRGRVRVRRTSSLFGDPRERLLIAGREETELLEGVCRKVAAVSELLGARVAVIGAMCFVESGGLPLFSNPTLDGVRIGGLRGIARLARRDGPHTPGEVREISERLRASLPEA
jgi:hypothetical protein